MRFLDLLVPPAGDNAGEKRKAMHIGANNAVVNHPEQGEPAAKDKRRRYDQAPGAS